MYGTLQLESAKVIRIEDSELWAEEAKAESTKRPRTGTKLALSRGAVGVLASLYRLGLGDLRGCHPLPSTPVEAPMAPSSIDSGLEARSRARSSQSLLLI